MTIEEKLAEFGARPRSIVLAPGELDTLLQLHNDRVHALETAAEADKARLEAAVRLLEARIKELLDQEEEPPAPPTTRKPSILDERFDKPLDMGIYYLDKDGEAGSIVVSNGQCLFRWKATSNLLDMRAQMVMKQYPGEDNGTPRRDPIGSERFYAFGMFLPPTYKFDAEWGNKKCVTAQVHQGNQGDIVSPPFSFEQIKTMADGEVMRGVLALKGRETKTWNIGKPPRTETKILIHVRWSAGTDGFLRVYRDGVLTPINHTGPTCNPRTLMVNGVPVQTQDLNHSLCNYNPGRKHGDFTVGYLRDVVFTHWLIGNETNTLEEMFA